MPVNGPVPETVPPLSTNVPESLFETTEALAAWLPVKTSEVVVPLNGADPPAQLVPADQFVEPLAAVYVKIAARAGVARSAANATMTPRSFCTILMIFPPK